MKIAISLILLSVLAAPSRAADISASAPATYITRILVAPIPLSTGWVEGFLLLIVWLFVAAILIGPLISFFRLEPRCVQRFSDDPKVRT
jgi:hypothetical protein